MLDLLNRFFCWISLSHLFSSFPPWDPLKQISLLLSSWSLFINPYFTSLHRFTLRRERTSFHLTSRRKANCPVQNDCCWYLENCSAERCAARIDYSRVLTWLVKLIIIFRAGFEQRTSRAPSQWATTRPRRTPHINLFLQIKNFLQICFSQLTWTLSRPVRKCSVRSRRPWHRPLLGLFPQAEPINKDW